MNRRTDPEKTSQTHHDSRSDENPGTPVPPPHPTGPEAGPEAGAAPAGTGQATGGSMRQPDPRPRDDYERDDPDERAGLRRPRGGTPNVAR